MNLIRRSKIRFLRMDWKAYFGDFNEGRQVEFVDVGCGYGGLLIKLSALYPDTLMVGLEIRVKVCRLLKYGRS